MRSALPALCLWLVPAGLAVGDGRELPDPRPRPAVDFVLDAFRTHSVVALGEAHGIREQHEFLMSVVEDPRFVERAGTVVVEFANARYQDRIDRYLGGEEVSADGIRAVWRDTTQALGGSWEPPIYASFFDRLRKLNRDRPSSHRVRVLAGDPPIDWGALSGREEFLRFQAERDPFLTRTILDGVLAKGEKALVVAGVGHLMRGPSAAHAAVVKSIEARYPGSVFVIHPITGFGERTSELEPELASWPVPGAAVVGGTWLGAIDASLGIGIRRVATPASAEMGRPGSAARSDSGETSIPLPGEKGPESRRILAKPLGPGDDPGHSGSRNLFEGEGVLKQEIADALLWLGPAGGLTVSVAPASAARDPGFRAEYERRYRLVYGAPPPLRPSSPH